MAKKIFYIILIFLISVFLFLPLVNMCYKDSIAIIGAMDAEIFAIESDLHDVKIDQKKGFKIVKGKLGGHKIILSKSGVGKVNSAITTQYIIDKYRPNYILNTGIAGSVDKKLKMGDVVIGDKAVQHDFDLTAFGYAKGYMSTGVDKDKPTVYYSNNVLVDLFKKKFEDTKQDKNLYIGTIATGDVFIDDKLTKNSIKTKFGAIAIDMESASIAQTAMRNNVPVVIIRTISDLEDDSAYKYEKTEEYYATKSAQTIVSVLREKSRLIK